MLKVPKSTVSSVIRKWREYGTTNYADSSSSWPSDQTEQLGKKDLGQGGDEEPNDHSDRTTEFLG